MNRNRLPNRRHAQLRNLTWTDGASEVTMTVDVGLYDDGTPGEVFADTGKTTAMQSMLDDACILISIAVQHGMTLDSLSKSLGTIPVWIKGEQIDAPASPIGAIIAAMAAEAGQIPMPKTTENGHHSAISVSGHTGAENAEAPTRAASVGLWRGNEGEMPE